MSHRMHVLMEVWPVRDRYLPALHGTQFAVPTTEAYAPAGQTEQTVLARLGAWVPMGQSKQLVEEDALPMVPEGHAMHAETPVLVEYVPSEQIRHTDPPGSGAKLPWAHTEQAVDAVATVIKPGRQRVHASRPVVLVYFPAVHSRQAGRPLCGV